MTRPNRTTADPIDPAVWRTVWTVLVGGMAVLFDTTIVAVALRTLAIDLHASVASVQWVSTGYLLTLGVTVPLAGWAQRVLGSRRLWLIALALFGVGSVLCSLAWSVGSLIAFRVVQGVGGGLIVPLMSTMVMQAAGGRRLGTIMSVVSLPAVLGPILGPVLGGLILQHLHWSWMFWVNVPFCVVGFVLAVTLLPADAPVRRLRFDLTGFVLLAPGLVGLLWGMSNAAGSGVGHLDVLAPVGLGVALLAGFVARTLRRGPGALLDLRLLRHRPLASSALLLFLSGVTLYGAMLLMPLYLQQVQGATVLAAGLLLIPQGLGTLVSRSLSGRLSDTFGSRWPAVVGFLLVLLGTLPFAFAGPHTDLGWLLVGLFVRGIGLGTVTVPLMALGFRGLERTEIPDASVITRIAQQVGGSFGTAVLALILTGAATGVAGAAGTHAGAGGAPGPAAFQQAFWWAVGFTLFGALISLTLPGRPAPVARHAAADDPVAATQPVG